MVSGVRHSPAALHLRPRSGDAQRIWHVGTTKLPASAPDVLRLMVRPGDGASFASLRSALGPFRDGPGERHREDLARLDRYLEQALPTEFPRGDDAGLDAHGRLMSDAVTFAIMRRISRESAYTARVIDLGARLLNALLIDVASEQNGVIAVVDGIDRIDRPSLKAFARAVLLLDEKTGVTWLWRSESDPRSVHRGDAPVDLSPESLYRWSRGSLLTLASAMTAPQFVEAQVRLPLEAPAPRSTSHLQVSNALVVQNYDACFLWSAHDESRRRDAQIERVRLVALAAINVGLKEAAQELLADAEAACDRPGRKAHLCYLQGLVACKRSYDLRASDEHYRRGLAVLHDGRDGQADVPLERAWLYNGLALNEAVRARRERDERAWQRALRLEQDAFALVSSGDDAARVYLRFNLIANSAFLLEMHREYDQAIRILTRAFDFGEGSPLASDAGRQAIAYRIGALHYRAGRPSDAARHIRVAANEACFPEDWPERERVERALGLIALERGRYARAEQYFSSGLARCLSARSADGTIEHARGLNATLLARRDSQRAEEIREQLAAEEGVELDLADGQDPASALQAPAPKLPAYVPEIDLEEIPEIDVNRFLAGVTRTKDQGPWMR